MVTTTNPSNKKNTAHLKQLKSYVWSGVNRGGEKTSGELSSRTLALAKAELRRQGISSTKIKKKSAPLFSKREKKVTAKDITVLSRQLATMLTAGIPLVQAFDIIGKGSDKAAVRALVLSMKIELESGKTLAESFMKHPKYFDNLYVNLIAAGEKSGSLDLMLDKVATYKEKIEGLKGKIKKALFYPAAVMVVAFIVTAALLIFVVPQFESLFKGFGADLPVMTQMVVNLSEIFKTYWWIIFGSLSLCIWLFNYFLKISPTFAYRVDSYSLRLPILGDIIQKATIARFTRTLAITFAAGLPLVDALKAVAGATGNLLYQEATNTIRDQISAGHQMQSAMRETNRFPSMVVQMIAVGEESGSLEIMLEKVADYYEEEVDNAVDSLSSLLEPLIMSILGVLIGGLVIAMYMPIFKMGSVI